MKKALVAGLGCLMFSQASMAFPQLEEVECLAQNIYFEARNQSRAGQIAVAHVTLNRVNSPYFPGDICSVVTEAERRNGVPIKNKCQFSWFCDGLSDHPLEQEEWARAMQVAYEAILIYNYDLDITEGSTHYHATSVNPRWASSFVAITQIDDHSFYRCDEHC